MRDCVRWVFVGQQALKQAQEWQTELKLAQPKRQGAHEAPSCPLSKFVITQASKGGVIALTTTKITRQHDIISFPHARACTQILWSDGPWTGREIEPAWENYYESQGYKPTATCKECDFKELCVLTSLTPTKAPPSPPSLPPSWCCRKCVSPTDCPRAQGQRPEPTMTNWGNASKTCASIPQDTAEHNRRELVAFCQGCWRFTDFRHNKGKIAALDLMTKLEINAHRTAFGTQGRLRGALTSLEIAKYVEHCLKPGKAPGPDKCPNELLKTMSEEEFLIVQAWVNEILTLPQKTIDTARQSRSTMNGTISQLHKGGSANKTSDQRPVVLLNSGYQLLNYIINERLKRIVEQKNVLEPGQGGGRQGRNVNVNMQKMHFVTHEAHRQGKRVYRVDIDFRNAFNAMSQTALWHVMNMFHIPDVDLLEQIYDSATVRMAPNDAESATITFDTGVAQGSITSPQLFNIFINALLRMLTATGRDQGISHGLQIGEDQDDSSQDADHGYQFNNIGFIDDISIFAETPEGMQTLLDVVQEFTAWCGMEINVKKTFLLVIDKDKKRRESIPAPDLRINGERLKTLDINDACRYLGYWGTGNGDMSATKGVVCEKARVARDLIKSHPLTPELATELFAQKGIGAFRFSAALIEWSQSELEGLKKIWVQAYKYAWHVPWSCASSLFTFPSAEGGHECPLPSGVLTQALLQHVDQCMRHEDVVKKIMLAQLARTLTEWHCNSFSDLIDEMELWDWNVANKDFWSRLAKSLHSQKVSVTWAEKMDKKLASVLVPEKISWAMAMRPIRRCKKRIEKIGGSRVDTEPTAWGLDVQVWNLLWTGEEAMKKGIPILKRAGFESVEDLPRTAVGFSSKAYQELPPPLRLSKTSNGEQRVRVRVPNAQGLHRTTQFLMQEYLNLVDWKSLELPLTQRRCKASVKKFERSPTALAEWIELKETLAKFQAERGNEMLDDKGSDDMPSKAERKRKPDASPVEFCRRSLAGGNVWDSLADLLKITKLRGGGADDVKEVREVVQHLFMNIVKPARSKRDNRQAKTHADNLLVQLVDDMREMWNSDPSLDRAQELIKDAIDKHAKYTTAELNRSRPEKKGAATRRRLGERVAANMHTMGTSFVGKVRDGRQIAEAQLGERVADMVEFEAQVNGHEATGKADRIQAWQRLADWQLAERLVKDKPVLLLPDSWWSGQHEPEFESAGWWQKPTRRAWCKQCARCGFVNEVGDGKDFHNTQLERGGRCLACKRGSQMMNSTPQQPLIGIIFTNVDPRYAGRLDDKQGGDTIVTIERVREAIAFNAELADESTWLWLTSEQMGFPLKPTGGGEQEERAEDLDSSQKASEIAYHLAPAITDFILDENRKCCYNELEQTLTLLHSEWSKEIEPPRQSSTHHPIIISNPIDKKGSKFIRRNLRWEAPSVPTAADDPGLLHEQETPLVIGKTWFLDQAIPAGGYVRIQDTSHVWEEQVDETRIITTEGLTTCLDPGRGWTITSGGWNFLKKQECWEDHEQALITTIQKETKRTEELEEAGYRSPTWAVLRALQQINSATRLEGEAAMSAPPFFQSAGRGDLLFWGIKEGPTVVIWESLSEQEKENWLKEASTMHDWVVWCKSKKGAEEIRSFELSGKEIFSNYDETKSKEEKNKKNGSKMKAHRGQSVRYRSWWKQGNIKMAMSEDHASCWVHKDLTVTTNQIQALSTAARASGGKDECKVRLKGIEREYWMGTEIGRLGGYGFRGTVTAGDGSNQKGEKMGAGYINLRKRRKREQRKVGREEEGSSSNRPELAAFVLALRDTPVTKPMLYLCDNQALLKAVKRWVGEGGKATLVGAPDADLLSEAIEELRKRQTAEVATFLVKVKAHRGEPANEDADIQADKAISSKDVPMEWHDRTKRAVFTWQEPRRKGGKVSYEDRKSTWNKGVRKAIRRGSAEEEVRKHRDRATGAWKQISKQRRQVDVSYDPSMVKALQHGTWMDEEGFKKTCIQEKKERGDIHQPVHGTWTADFMLREDAGRFMQGKYLSEKKNPWRRRRRLIMAVAGITPTASWLTKIRKMQSPGCRLCKKAREARGESTDGLAEETHGHINSASCEGMVETVTAAHHSIWRHLYDSMHAAQKPKSKLKFVTLDKESNMSTLWQLEEFLRICSKEDLAKKAQDIEVTIPVTESQKARYNTDPQSFFVNRFWGRRPDGVVIDEARRRVYILEFKRSTDRDEGFLEVKEAEANEQHKSIIGALRAAAPKWFFEQINFVVGNRGSVVEGDFYTKLKKLDVEEGKKDKLFADHVTQVFEAHNRVIVSFLQQVQGGTRPSTEGSRENIGHNVHV